MPAPPTEAARNLELKARVTVSGMTAIRERLRAWIDPPFEVQQQVDRYFDVPAGRLKLRTIVRDDGASSAELIAYRRPDVQGPRWSGYGITPLAPDQARQLAATLERVVPVLVKVRKRREIAIVGSTRVHLDDVEELGTFVELETVIGDQADEDAEREHRTVIARLGLDAWPVEAGSYSDLLRQEHANGTDR